MFINEKLLNMQSAYSKSKSQKAKTDPGTWSYNIQTGYFPSFPASTFRILTINLCRFPMTHYSTVVIASLILSAQPHIVFMQEVSRIAELRELIALINTYKPDREYDVRWSKSNVRNLQLAILFDSVTCSLNSFEFLFHDYSPPFSNFSRPPIHLNLSSNWFEVDCLNLHLPSNHTIGASSKRADCFQILSDYYTSLDSDVLYLLGGDWNTASSSDLFTDDLPDFRSTFSGYSWNADAILNNKNAESNIIASSPTQQIWNYATYNQITKANWLLYVSDHLPVVCDYKII